MTQRRPSISQIAREAGVSVSTVSRVMNEHPDVSQQAREQVMAVVERLGYRRNAVARSLITRRTHTLALIMSDISPYGASAILSEAEAQTQALGYRLYFSMVRLADAQHVADVLQDLLSYGVDGFIWAVMETTNTMAHYGKMLSNLSTPIVCITADMQLPLPSVVCDNRLGGRLATEYLLQQGYQHVGHIAGLPGLVSTEQRRRGWEDALIAAGLPPQTRQVIPGDWTAISGEQGLHCLAQQFPEMDAVFVSNDQMALGALRAASALRLSVPGRLGIVGFDNTPESPCYLPSLTTIYNPFQEIGASAVQLLVRILRDVHQQDASQVENAGAPTKIVLKPNIVMRESAAGVRLT